MDTVKARRAPYKDFLQPALHRRFTTTATILLAVAYLEALCLAQWDSILWAWLPFGWTGVRTTLLLACGILVIVLRIAQYHVGLRTSRSAFHTFLQHALKLPTAEAIFTYVVSATLFSQVYLWSIHDAGLDWLVYFTEARARLNERPLFFTSYFISLGLVQAALHIYNDTDRLSLGVVRPQDAHGNTPSKEPVHQIRHFLDQVPVMVATALNRSFAALGVNLIVYFFFLRTVLWRSAMIFLRPFVTLPKTKMLPTTIPFTLWTLFRCCWAGFLLLMLWNAGNVAFSIFLVKEPLKNNKPLTSESKDPNGSLLNGLKSKKLAIKCFAMWELAFIARNYEDRRKAIYEDMERKDGAMWSQTCTICRDVINSMAVRIDNFTEPPAPAASVVEEERMAKKRSTAPLKQDPIMLSTPKKHDFRSEVEKSVGNWARVPGQSSPLSPTAQKAAAVARQKLLEYHQEATGEAPKAFWRRIALQFLRYPIGFPFRMEYRRQATAVILGTPIGEPSLYINAIFALTELISHSLTEDRYGNVQRDVANIIRTLTSVTKKIESFTRDLPTHWTDVAQGRTTPEVDAILDALKTGLGRVVEDFGDFARDLRLTAKDMREAREAAAPSAGAMERRAGEQQQQQQQPEMQEVR